jgi:hypothetical protein
MIPPKPALLCVVLGTPNTTRFGAFAAEARISRLAFSWIIPFTPYAKPYILQGRYVRSRAGGAKFADGGTAEPHASWT